MNGIITSTYSFCTSQISPVFFKHLSTSNSIISHKLTCVISNISELDLERCMVVESLAAFNTWIQGDSSQCVICCLPTQGFGNNLLEYSVLFYVLLLYTLFCLDC